MRVLIFICCFVRYFLGRAVYLFMVVPSDKRLLSESTLYLDFTRTHNVALEILWTIIPRLILISILLPSLALIHSVEDLQDPTITVKVTRNHGYWNYSVWESTRFRLPVYADARLVEHEYVLNVSWDSYIVLTEDPNLRELRVLEVDEPLWLPINIPIRFLFTSNDVVHSWDVPSLGIKGECVPRHLNQLITTIKVPGVYYRQCSTLCRALHNPIPIKVEADDYEFIWCIWYLYSEPKKYIPY